MMMKYVPSAYILFILLACAVASTAFEYRNNPRTGKPDLVTTRFRDMSGFPIGVAGKGVCWKTAASFGHFSSDGTCR